MVPSPFTSNPPPIARPEWTSEHQHISELIDTFQNEKLAEKLEEIKDGLNASHRFQNGDFTLLFHAVVKGNRDAFLMLLKAGADPDRRNCAGNNVLHLIVKRGLVEWAEACIKVHEDMLNNPTRIKDFLNQGSYIGWTTLMQSCENERFHMVEWLLQNGADPNVQMTVTGWTAMHAAAKVGHHNILKALLEKGGDKTLRARNQSLGNNLTVEDCTSDENLLKLLEKYPRPQCPPVN